MSVLSAIAIALSLLVISFAYLSPSVRHTIIDGKLYEALHVRFPGYVESYSPEHVIQLKDWAGSTYPGITVTVDDQRNAEIEAEPALRAIGWATEDYVRELGADGHWVLRKPEQKFCHFSMFSWHRVSSWELTEE